MPEPETSAWWRSVELRAALGLLVALAAIAWFGMEHVFALLEALDGFVQRHYWGALVLFALGFVGLILTTLPVGTVFCLAGGYFFGLIAGATTALLAGTIGALLTLVLIRAAGAGKIRKRTKRGRTGPWLDLLERDITWYLILLRIIPVAPFFLVNAAAAMTRVRAGHFTAATAIGLLPTTVLYAAVGRGLDSISDTRERAGPGLLLEPTIGLPLLGLAVILIGSWWIHKQLQPRPDQH